MDAAPPLPNGQSSKSSSGLPAFHAQLQQQQRPAHNLGLTDAEVLSLISQGSKPLQDTHSLLNTLQKLQLSQR